jgi:hypothetical protein
MSILRLSPASHQPPSCSLKIRRGGLQRNLPGCRSYFTQSSLIPNSQHRKCNARQATAGRTAFASSQMGVAPYQGVRFSAFPGGSLYNLSAGFSTLDINDRHDISGLVITHAPGARPLFPLSAKCVALDVPFAVHHASPRSPIQSRTIRVPIDHTTPDFNARGFHIGGVA